VDVSLTLNPVASALVEAWAQGCDWNRMIAATNIGEGDIVRQLRRTADVLRQIHRISGLPLRLIQLAREALKLIYREPIKEIELPEENDLLEQEAEKPDLSEEAVTLSFAEPVPAATEDS